MSSKQLGLKWTVLAAAAPFLSLKKNARVVVVNKKEAASMRMREAFVINDLPILLNVPGKQNGKHAFLFLLQLHPFIIVTDLLGTQNERWGAQHPVLPQTIGDRQTKDTDGLWQRQSWESAALGGAKNTDIEWMANLVYKYWKRSKKNWPIIHIYLSLEKNLMSGMLVRIQNEHSNTLQWDLTDTEICMCVFTICVCVCFLYFCFSCDSFEDVTVEFSY